MQILWNFILLHHAQTVGTKQNQKIFWQDTIYLYQEHFGQGSNMSIVITRPVKSDWGHFNCCDNINHLTVYKLKKNGLIV